MQFYSLSRPILLTARHKMALLYLLQRRPKTWNEFVIIDSLTDDELFQSTRFPRQAIHELVDLLHDDLECQTERSHSVPVET